MGMLYYIKGNNSNYIGLDIHGGPGSYGRVTDHILAGYFGKPAELGADEAPKIKDGTAFEQEVAKLGAYTYQYYVLFSEGYGVQTYYDEFSKLWEQKDLAPEKRLLSFAEMVYIYLHRNGAASSNTQCGGYKHKFYFKINNYLKENGWTDAQIKKLNLSNVELTWSPSGTTNSEDDMDKLFYPQKYVFKQVVSQTINEVWSTYGSQVIKEVAANLEIEDTGQTTTKQTKDGFKTIGVFTLKFKKSLESIAGPILEKAHTDITKKYEPLNGLITLEWVSNWKTVWIKHFESTIMKHFSEILNHLAKKSKDTLLNKNTEKEIMTVPEDILYSIKPLTKDKPKWLPASVGTPNIEITDYVKNFSAIEIFPNQIKAKAQTSKGNWKRPIRDYITNSTKMAWLNNSTLFEQYYQQHVNAMQRVENGKEIFEEASWEYGIYKVNGEKVGEDRIMFRRPNWKEAIVITVEEYEKIKAGENITIF